MTDSQRHIVLAEASAVLREIGSAGMRLHRLCDYLRQYVAAYDWVGFYLAVPGEGVLVLGPFSGAPTDHLRIPYGRGVCGQAAAEDRTIVVPDVAQEANYLACSVHVKSEIVVPVHYHGKLAGEIDIDSHTPDAFSEQDRLLLEELALECSELVNEVAPGGWYPPGATGEPG